MEKEDVKKLIASIKTFERDILIPATIKAKKEVFDDLWNANLIYPKDDEKYKKIEKKHLGKQNKRE